MRVKELIKLLKTANPDAEIIHYCYDDWAVSSDGNIESPANVDIQQDKVVFS